MTTELVARVLSDYHLPLIRSGLTRTILRWVRTLPDESILEHPESRGCRTSQSCPVTALSSSGGISSSLIARGQSAASVSRRTSRRLPCYSAIAIDGGVAQAVENGRRAVELAGAVSDQILTGALTGYARALYFVGDLDAAWETALSVIEHPSIERRVPSHALARTTSCRCGRAGVARVRTGARRAGEGGRRADRH